MTKKVFSCVLIGLGDIGLNYDLHQDQDEYIKTHARAFALNSGFDLKAGVDIDNKACNIFSERYAIDSYNEIEDALLRIKPDLIILAVPTSLQIESIRRIIKCFIPKIILCEKPMGNNLAEGKEIVSTCSKYNINLYVNYVRRCLPGSKEVKERIDNGLIKAPIKCVFWYSKGLKHNGSHYINLMEYWFGKLQAAQVVNKGREFPGFGFEPYAYLKFNNCEVSIIPAWEECYSHYTIEIISSTGRLYWNQDNLEWTKVTKSENFKGYNFLANKSEKLFTGAAKYQMHVADELYLALTGEFSSICTGEQALETLCSIDSILTMN